MNSEYSEKDSLSEEHALLLRSGELDTEFNVDGNEYRRKSKKYRNPINNKPKGTK